MLIVIDPGEVLPLIEKEFPERPAESELLSLDHAVNRVLAYDIRSEIYVPDFNRSLVDGYAVAARDTFGCSDAIPAVLPIAYQVHMGESPSLTLTPGTCVAIPTGGAVPDGADAVQMLEYTEDYGDGTVGICKPAAPGNHMVYRGDDISPGDLLLHAGHTLLPKDIGALAALGCTQVSVIPRIRIGIISSGDELIPAGEQPAPGQIRDVNSHLLQALLSSPRASVKSYGIVSDRFEDLVRVLQDASASCDLILLSGGSSAGEKDLSRRAIEELGDVLFHGIAMKPGKPTILGRINHIPVFCLPGHPAAAYFVTALFIKPLANRMAHHQPPPAKQHAVLSENISANHGRAQYNLVRLEQHSETCYAYPIHSKSGLITSLARADGYICIPRDSEGIPAGSSAEIFLFNES